MADDDDISDGEIGEEEKEPEAPGIDYEELDSATGFKKTDYAIWKSYEAAILLKPEDDREDEEEWAENYCTENNVDKNRVTMVTKLGIYAGARDEFNQRTGEGKAIYANGDTYEGQYWEGKKNGHGKYVHKSLGMSEVDKLLEKLHKEKEATETPAQFIKRAAEAIAVGHEIVRAALENGFYPCYNGAYINNLKHGKGVMKNKDGTVYKGDWKDNKRHGEGVYCYLNGDIYSGQWEEGLKHGSACYEFADNKGSYIGTWEKGVFKEGQWIMTDGNYYEGRFDGKNRPCDPMGVIKFPFCALVQQGDYKKGKWCPTDQLVHQDDYQRAQDEAAAAAELELEKERLAAEAAAAETQESA
uniref:MORN repeat-containing protein 5 n=1 Tax=Eutreptiella gymnastica TaxID=73025 RepID=A0A7S1IU63_9EUGL|mmetsp:Transcript_42851/g.76976  ORF Transcript_42851/g.76976 Transcript_42851/m.76976 type:complete len:357 (+) Transcript_42851:88-1158(+)